MSQSASQGSDKLEINLTPLLDLVLQLIMFFMLTVNFVRVDMVSDNVVLPVVQSAMPIKTTGDNLVYISITDKDERLGAGAKLTTTAKLQSYILKRKRELETLAEIKATRTGQKVQYVPIVVVLRAHRDASWGIIWDTLTECEKAGYNRWQLRVVKQAKGG